MKTPSKYAFAPYGADGAVVIGLPVKKYTRTNEGKKETWVILKEVARRRAGRLEKGDGGHWHRPLRELKKLAR